MTMRRIARRYVQGFLMVAREQNCVDEAERCLEHLDGVFQQAPEVLRVLHHPTISGQKKKKILDALLDDGAPAIVGRLTDYVIDKKREAILDQLYREYKAVADELRGIARARVKSACALTVPQTAGLKHELGKRLSMQIELEVEVDPALLGGMQIFIATHVIDGSVTGRLGRLHRSLLKGAAVLNPAA